MNERLNRGSQTQRISRRTNERLPVHYRRPFWLPTSNYYILTLSVTVAFFFLVSGILHEGDEETPFIVAGIGASLVLGSAVVIREIFLRKVRQQYLLVERKLDYNMKIFSPPSNLSNTDFNKLTLEKNAAIIKEIQKKSETARGLGNLSDGHLEVFKICNKYLSVAEKQMETVRVGSPRLAGLRRGREIVGELHRYHLLYWTEIEARELTQKARNYVTVSEKLNTAHEALNIVESALRFYPQEARLTESESALKDFIASIKISHRIEQAERSAFKGNYKRAINLYQDALFFLDREDLKNEDRQIIANKINVEIESLRQLSENKKLL